MKNMAMTIVACGDYHVLIWLHTADNPSAEEWESGLPRIAELKRKLGQDVSKVLTLAVSDGGAPNSVQRGQYTDLLEGKPKAAGVTSQLSNRLIRGVATAIFWLNPNFRAYSPDQFDLALEHLNLASHRATLLAALKELQKQVPPIQTLSMLLEHEKKA